MATAARNQGAVRALVEAAAALDPVIADFVYIVDHKLATAGYTGAGSDGKNVLNTWHSFGRPEIIRLQDRMCRERAETDGFLMLPCSRHRPYDESRTHIRLRLQLRDAGQNVRTLESVVVTALGVVPERYWREPLVMSYDAGAVDLWRVFQLLRAYFTLNPTRTVVDCLSFRPYSEMLDLLHNMGVIPAPVRPLKVRWRGFHVRLQ
jgi:predicted RNA-binding protein